MAGMTHTHSVAAADGDNNSDASSVRQTVVAAGGESPKSGFVARSIQGPARKMNWRIYSSLGRHGIGLLLITGVLVMWTTSNFLSSGMFADKSYSKPFFVTYTNTAFFIILLPVMLYMKAKNHPEDWAQFKKDFCARVPCLCVLRRQNHAHYEALDQGNTVEDPADAQGYRTFLAVNGNEDLDIGQSALSSSVQLSSKMPIMETAMLGFRFSWLWFAANYTIAASFEYSDVATTTVITSLSGVFTFLFGLVLGVHKFNTWKLAAVLACCLGVCVIYWEELWGASGDDEHRGDFPEKTRREKNIGVALALGSAICYGYYSTLMKRDCVDEKRIDFLLFFSWVGVSNVFLLWPIFIVLHYTGWEPFQFPPTLRIALFVATNSIISGISDIMWAAAVLVTSPVLVTVCLSLSTFVTIIAEWFVHGQTVTFLYWAGSAILVAAAIGVDRAESGEGEQEPLAARKGDGVDLEAQGQESAPAPTPQDSLV